MTLIKEDIDRYLKTLSKHEEVLAEAFMFIPDTRNIVSDLMKSLDEDPEIFHLVDLLNIFNKITPNSKTLVDAIALLKAETSKSNEAAS